MTHQWDEARAEKDLQKGALLTMILIVAIVPAALWIAVLVLRGFVGR